MDALDEGDVVVRATEASFQQWERCRSSPSSAECTVPTGPIIAEKTPERGPIDNERASPSSSVEKSPFGILGVDYVRVTSIEELDRDPGLAATSGDQFRLHIAFSVVVLCGCWLTVFMRSKRIKVNTGDGIDAVQNSHTTDSGQEAQRDEDQKKARNASDGSLERGDDTFSQRRIAPQSCYEDGSSRRLSGHLFPSLVDETEVEVKATPCPATAPSHLGEAVRGAHPESGDDEAISRIVSVSAPFTPQRAARNNEERGVTNAHAMTLTFPPKPQIDQMVSLVSEEFEMEENDAKMLVVQELFKENRDRRRSVTEESRHRESISAIRGEVPLEERIQAAKVQLQAFTWNIFPGRHFIRSIGLSLLVRIVGPVMRKAWGAASELNGVALTLDILASDLCGCSKSRHVQTHASPYLAASWVPSLDNVIPSYFPHIGVVLCFFRLMVFLMSLAFFHWLMRFIHAKKSAHDVLNLFACFLVTTRLAANDAEQSTSSLVLELLVGATKVHTCLWVMLRTIALSKGTQQRMLHLLRFGNVLEAQLSLFSLAEGGAIIISTLSAVWNGIAT